MLEGLYWHRKTLFGSLLGLILISAISYSFSPSLPQTPKPFWITLNDGGIEYRIITEKTSIAALLTAENIVLRKEDLIMPYLESGLSPKVHVFIQRAIPITIEVEGSPQKLYTQAKTIRQVLEENNIFLEGEDRVEISSLRGFIPEEVSSPIHPEMEIKIIRVKEEIITKIVPLDFQVLYQSDPNLSYGRTKILQSGKRGEKEQTWKLTFENGKEVKREQIKERTLKNPVPQIVKKGTKIEIGKIEEGLASWYDYPYWTRELPAASRTFPRGTYLKVTNLENGESVIVKVRDFGPNPYYHPERIIDLDISAFKRVAFLNKGIIKVKVEEIL